MSVATAETAATNPVEILAAHVVDTTFDDLPASAVLSAKTFILDSLGVGVAGSAGAWVSELLDAVAGWGTGDDSRAFVHGTRLPAASAAVVNAYFIHCLEYDCVNERAVIHPMATILGALSAEAERRGDVSGRDLLTAVAVGVDSSCVLGLSSNAAMRFFRPSTAGAFGATAAIAKLRGFDVDTTINAFGATYGQISGTLQPHKEGSPVLGMQIGFCARGAIVACDLAERGLIGPHDVFDGQYGYFPLYEGEGEYDWQPVFAKLGNEWQINNVSHKPFPSGRLTHGAVDGVQQIQAREDFAASDVAKIVAIVPPLAYRLTGRPDIANPEPNYAKLCIPFVAATTVLEGTVDVRHFQRPWLDNPAVHDLAARVECVQDDNPDQNVVAPQRLEMTLKDGRHFVIDMPEVFGHPANPLSRDQNIDKFRRNWQLGARPLPVETGERMVASIDDLESVANVADLIGLTVA
jgi:2-methylcitrate dehydratase PrpD